MTRSLANFTLGLVSLLALPACNQLEAIEEESGSGPSGGVPPEVRAAFEQSCGISGCHSPGGQSPVLAGPDLDGIVGGMASGSSIPLVTLGDTANSYIAIKMLPEPVVAALGVARTGAQMPPGASGPNPNVTTILAWIAGAPFEGGGDTGEPGDTGDTGDTGTTGEPGMPTLTAVQAIFDAKCSCHLADASPANGNLNLSAGMTFANVVNVASGQATIDLVEPMDPDNSYLLLKVDGRYLDAPGGGGDLMPLGGMLSDAELATIEEWIAAGAEDN